LAAEINKLLDVVIKHDGSDLHLAVGRAPAVRLSGQLRDIGKNPLRPDDTVALMKSITSERHQRELNEVGGCDFGMAYEDKARFRVSVYRQKGNISIVLRLIPSRILTFEQLGLPDIIKEQCMKPRGLFMVTGPTGSGKTTTLATMIDYINENRADHILTIEDPIEYYHQHKKCIVSQREVGTDVPDFAEGLRRGLRQDPDVILVGEMRDLETIRAALTAAETGHLVFGTVHTTGAAKTVDRIIDVFPTDEQEHIRVMISTSLNAIVSQNLLARADTGGRIAAYEIMFANDAIRNLIRESKAFRIPSFIQTGGSKGMILLDDYLFRLWAEGTIKYESMMERVQDPEAMKKKIQEYMDSRPGARRR
jgi:twitching motility protein PilT